MTQTREIQLRLVFTNYEIQFLDQFLNSHVQTIQRHNPHLHFEIPTLKKELTLLQFNPNLTQNILAFEIFVFQVQLIQSYHPHPNIFYTGVLKELSKLFPQAYLVTEDFQPKGVSAPLIPLQTENGSYKLPALDHSDSLQPIVLETFPLHLSIEHFQFAISPFKDWKPVQTLKGSMSFSLTASINHPMPSIQNPISAASTSANPKVLFNQPFAHYQHPPPPSHLNPLTTTLLPSTPSQPITSSNKTNHVSASQAPNTNTAIPRSDSQSFLLNTTDDYFYDEYFVNHNNVTTNATIDSQTTLQEQEASNTDNSEEPSSYSPRTR